MGTKKATLFFLLSCTLAANAQLAQDLVLEDPEDIKLLMEEFPQEGVVDTKSTNDGGMDELDALKEDLGDIEFALPENETLEKDIPEVTKPKIIIGEAQGNEELIFDVGKQ